MANLNGDIKKWKRGETAGVAATVLCGVVLIFFVVCFSIARVQGIKTLELVALIVSPVLMVAGIAASAFCNFKYGDAVEKAIRQYVIDVFSENAKLLHPERDSLSFYITVNDSGAEMQVNGYKEKIAFDFSTLGKLSVARKVAILTEIENRLLIAFCRLYDKGVKFNDVAFAEREGTRRKSGKTVFIIKDGSPDVKAYKKYLKNK